MRRAANMAMLLLSVTPVVAEAQVPPKQTITLTAPLVDKDGDGKVVVTTQAKTLGVPSKSVLTLCSGTKATYAVNGAPCPVRVPVAAPAPATAPPLIMREILSSAKVNGAVKPDQASRTVIRDAYRGIETSSTGTYAGVTIDNLHLLNVQREGVRLRGKVSNFTLRNFRIEHGPNPNKKPDLPEGIHVETGTNLLFQDGFISGMKMTGLAYNNGDGIAIEKPVVGVTIRRVDSRDHSDAAFDTLKGRDILLEDSVGAFSSRCNKTGAANLVAVRLTCIGNQTVIEFHGGDATYDGLTVDLAGRTGKTWVFSLAAGSGKNLVTLRNCRFVDSTKAGGKPSPLPKYSIFMGKGPGVTVDADPSCSAWPK